MSLIELILVLAVAGFVSWLVLTYIPMPPVFKNVILVVIVVMVVLWLLKALGLSNLMLPRIR